MPSAESTDPLHADHTLARRLEALCAVETRRFAETSLALDPSGGADWSEIAGGVAAYVGADSPVNQACGLGMSDPVVESDIVDLERFYLERGARPSVGVCPLAHPTLVEILASRGWAVEGFENVLVRPLRADESFDSPAPCIEIRQAESEEDRELWALIAATGFSAPLPPLKSQLALGHVIVHRPGAQLLLAFVDGKPAGTGELLVEDGVAWLSADTTLPQFRGRGVQQSLQRHRLAAGRRAGCTLAATESTPGSGSQRNMERAEFRVVYTRADYILPQPAESRERSAE